jgi:arsenate reductase
MSDITIFHNPACGTSRNVLAMIRNSGVEPSKRVSQRALLSAS